MIQVYKINASAGSGKTYKLTRRFLELLANSELDLEAKCYSEQSQNNKKYNFSEILAVTFTNLAANQMKERVITTLKQIALGNNLENDNFTQQEAAHVLTYIFRHYGSLNIKTIDSLLQQLVRLSCLELEISPEFETTFSEELIISPLAKEIALEAFEQDWLKNNFEDFANTLIEKSTYFNRFFYGEEQKDRLVEIVKNIISKEDENLDFETSDYFNNYNSVDYYGQNHEVQIDILFEKLANPAKLTQIQLEVEGKFIEAAKDLQSQIAEEKLIIGKAFSNFFAFCLRGELKDSVYTDKENFDTCVLTKSPRPSEQTESSYQVLKNRIKKLAQINKIVEKAKQFYCLYELGIFLERKLWQREKSDGLILSQRISSLVKKVLSHEYYLSGALCRLGSKLQHILLDEFQDTNKAQWQAINPLAKEVISGGGSVFFVGDVKQAIYGWRGGDADLFHQAPDQLKALSHGFEDSNLEYNWRSFAHIINFNNAFFKLFSDVNIVKGFLHFFLSKNLLNLAEHGNDELLKSMEQAAIKIQNTYTYLHQEIPKKSLENQQGLVQVHKLNLPEEHNYLGALALTCNCIQKLSQRHEWQDICVLTLTNAQADNVAALLISQNIPVVSQGSLLLAEQPIIKELIAFMRFLASPYDEMAFYHVLVSKHIFPHNLIEENILDFVVQKNNKPLFMAVKKNFPEIWEYYLKPLQDGASLMTAYDTLNEIYTRFQVRENNPQSELFLSRLLEIVHLAEENNYMDLTSFLNWWDEFNAEEKAPLPQNTNAVQVMTVHKAKGLEFEAVVMPFVDLKAEVDKDKLDFIEFYHDDIPYLVYSSLLEEHGQRFYQELFDNVLERINNLYVAFTRPIKEMHIFMTPNSTKNSLMGLNHLWEVFLNNQDFCLNQLEKYDDYISFGNLPNINSSLVDPLFLRLLEYLLGEQLDEHADTSSDAQKGFHSLLKNSKLTVDFFQEDFEKIVKKETIYYSKIINKIYQEEILKENSKEQEKPKIKQAMENSLQSKNLLTQRQIEKLGLNPMDRPMAWLPRLKILRKDLQELYNYPSLSANKRGTIIHSCLENLVYSGNPLRDAKKAVQETFGYYPQSLMSRDELDKIVEILIWFLGLDEPFGGARSWFEYGLKAHSLVSSAGNIYRIDLLVPLNKNGTQEFLAIDYKTGYNGELPNKENIRQMHNYQKLLRGATSQKHEQEVIIHGLLIYLDRKEIHKIT